MIRRGRPSLRPTAVADTASGGATIAPSVSAAATVSSGTVLKATKPTANVVASGSPTASSPIGPDVLLQRDVAALQARRPQQRRQQHDRARAPGSSSMSVKPGIVLAARPATTRASGADTSKRRASAASSTDNTSTASREPCTCQPPRPKLDGPALSLDSMLKRSRGRDDELRRLHRPHARISWLQPRRTRAAYSRTVPGLRRARREYLGASADVPDVRSCRLLRLEPASARERTLPRHRPPRDAVSGAGGGLAMVLHRRPARAEDLAGLTRDE